MTEVKKPPVKRKASVFFDVDESGATSFRVDSATPAEVNAIIQPPTTTDACIEMALQLLSAQDIDQGLNMLREAFRITQRCSGESLTTNQFAMWHVFASQVCCGEERCSEAVEFAEQAVSISRCSATLEALGWSSLWLTLHTEDTAMRHDVEASAVDSFDHALTALKNEVETESNDTTVPTVSIAHSAQLKIRAALTYSMVDQMINAALMAEEVLQSIISPMPFIILSLLHSSSGDYVKACQSLEILFQHFPQHVVGQCVYLALEAHLEKDVSKNIAQLLQQIQRLSMSMGSTGIQQNQLEGVHQARCNEGSWGDQNQLEYVIFAYYQLLLQVMTKSCLDVSLRRLVIDSAAEYTMEHSVNAPNFIYREILIAEAQNLLLGKTNHGISTEANLKVASDKLFMALQFGPNVRVYEQLGTVLLGQHAIQPKDTSLVVVASNAFDMAVRMNPRSTIALKGAAQCRKLLGDCTASEDFYMSATLHEAREPILPFSALILFL